MQSQVKIVHKTSSSDDILDDSDESEEHAKQVTDFLAQIEREEKIEREIRKNQQVKIVTPLPIEKKFGGFDMHVAKQKADGLK